MCKVTSKTILTLAVSVSAMAGCVSSTPDLDSKFGDAVILSRAQQTVNPAASQNTDPVAGIDGKAAAGARDRYNKSYEHPPASGNVFMIGVGGGSGNPAGSTTSGTR